MEEFAFHWKRITNYYIETSDEKEPVSKDRVAISFRTRVLADFLKEDIYPKCRVDPPLYFESLCSVGIPAQTRVINKNVELSLKDKHSRSSPSNVAHSGDGGDGDDRRIRLGFGSDWTVHGILTTSKYTRNIVHLWTG